jgi:hypothetical protein
MFQVCFEAEDEQADYLGAQVTLNPTLNLNP